MGNENEKSVRKRKLKALLAKGKDAKNSLLEAGYTPATAHKSTTNKVVQVCYNELEAQAKAKQVTPEFVLSGLINNLTAEDAKAADRNKTYELLGKHLRLWNEQATGDKTAIFADILAALPGSSITLSTQAPKDTTVLNADVHKSSDDNNIHTREC